MEFARDELKGRKSTTERQHTENLNSVRILHVYRTFFPDTQGGLEEVIRQLCRGTKALGAVNTVLTTSKHIREPDEVLIEGARVVRVPENFEIASCNVAVEAFAVFNELLRQNDLVYYHFPWPFADLLNLSAKQKKPVVITYHSDIVRQKFLFRLYAPLMRHFLRSADRIVCTSPNYFATSDALTENAQRVEIIPIGLDADSYPALIPEVIDEAETHFGRDFFLFVGVLRYYKCLPMLLHAAKDAPYKVVIVGSGPIEAELRKLASELELDNVFFTGHISDEYKVALFHLCRAVVFPSFLRAEAFGVTLLEGAMHARPLISTEVGSGTSHVNVHDKTGVVVTPGSAKSLRTAMDYLDGNAEMAKLMGIRAKQRFDKLFSGDLMAKRYWKLYTELVDEPQSEEAWRAMEVRR